VKTSGYHNQKLLYDISKLVERDLNTVTCSNPVPVRAFVGSVNLKKYLNFRHEIIIKKNAT
jgi:hypothetical protein